MEVEQVSWQIALGIIVPFLLQWLKRQPWFIFLNTWSSRQWKITVSALAACASALGLACTFDPTVGRLVIDGLTWANVGHALLAFALSFATQHVAYVMPGIGAKAIVTGGAK